MRAKAKRKPTRTYMIAGGVRTYPDGREECIATVEGKQEYDRRRDEMAKRQRGICPCCYRPLGNDVTFDHQAGRTSGRKDERLWTPDGSAWMNAAVHLGCNGKMGSVRHHWTAGNTAYVPLGKESR